MQLLIKQATILCPTSKHHLKKRDLLISGGLIEKIGANIIASKASVVADKNLYVSTGWCDLFADFSEPGYEQNETLQTGSNAAALGGYTDVCLIPNTNPVTQHKSQIEFIKNHSSIVNLHPLGALSKNTEGKDLAEMYDMALAGAVGFTDGKKSVQQSSLMLKALQYIKTFNGVIIDIPDDRSLSQHGLMHEGIVSTQLGMPGKPAIAEHIAIQKNLELLQYTNSALHFTGVSTKRSIVLIKQAKKSGLNVSCSVNVHHLILTDENLREYDSHYKINPPLRSKEDQDALIKGIEDGVIDAIASHHLPQNWDAKQQEFEYAKNGMISLQIILPLLLKLTPRISIEKWIDMLTAQPRNILNQPSLAIAEQQAANLTIFSTSKKWVFDEKSNQSKSANSPYFGQEMIGKVLAIVNNQQIMIHE